MSKMRYLDFAESQHQERGPTRDREAAAGERLVVAVDESPSMLEPDWLPSRLIGAQQASCALVERKRQIAPDDEVGIVAYAGYAQVIQQLVVVGEYHAQLTAAIWGIQTGSGTSISRGLTAAGELLLPETRKSFVQWLLGSTEAKPTRRRTLRIILLTDGFHNTGKDPVPVAQRLKDAGVCIDCIGIGGDPAAVNAKELRAIASLHADGVTPRYAFIGDKDSLIQKFEELAGRITR